MKISSKTKIKFAFLWVIMLCLITVYAAVLWGIGHYTKEALEHEKSAKSILADKQRADGLRSIAEKTVEERALVLSFIPSSAEVVVLIEIIESLAKDVGLTAEIQSVSTTPLPGKAKLPWENLHLVIETNGSWKANNTFVYMLENLSYKNDIKRVNLEKRKGGDEKTEADSWRGEFTMVILKDK